MRSLFFRAAGILFFMLVIMHSNAQGRQMPTNRTGTSAARESGKAQQQPGKSVQRESDRPGPVETRKAGDQLFEVSPKPVIDYLCINSPEALPAGKFTIQIMNIQGKLLYTVLLVAGTTKLKVSKFTSGTYVYEIRKDQKIVQTGEFIKQ